MPKIAPTEGFSDSTQIYRIDDGPDFRAEIRAKDFPSRGPNGTFRVYAVYGDVTKPDRLTSAIGRLLVSRGITRRRIEVSL